MGEISRRRADWSNLRVFFAVAETGGINAAARALQINPSTVTRAIEELERQLNATLFHRGPRGATLTEAGEAAFQRVRTMERMAEALELEVGDSETLAEGRVRLAAPDGVAGYFISPHQTEFLRAHPGIDLSIDCGLWPDRPLDGEADLTLTFSEPTQPDAVAQPIAYVHYALFASREYVSLYGAPKTIEDMLHHPYIHHSAQTHQKELWGERVQAWQTLTHKRIETNSSSVCVQAVLNGVGIGAMPTAIASVEPDLVMLDVLTVGPAKLWLVHHRDAVRPARVRLVKDWLKAIFDPKTRPWYRSEFVHPDDFAAEADKADGASKGVRKAG
ncbi:LysR family transcriptional regulator [Phenylobacterium sp.]|uniref:LysR family transcriptional regulator n=1 Tax=Phenylobacterium sp. TaxID=1871053 RepID=UPI002C7145CB|nr:LysR family transcriptional regulator [Phenylobacterium sp.]HLZ73881.1 LysR family transcriptional regulator [Phenylobacterium sp.]